MDYTVRLAELSDLNQIESLMKRSMKVLGTGHYSEKQIESCCQFVCVPDQQLIEDKTFFVVFTEDGTLVGCGGWSFRNKLYAGPTGKVSKKSDRLNPLTDPARIRAMFIDPGYSGQGIGSLILDLSEKAAKSQGFSKGALGSTLSGLAFYTAKGWNEVSEEQALLPDGIAIKVVQMEKCFKSGE
jgi:GNAT superfamily N-acetyltransferase